MWVRMTLQEEKLLEKKNIVREPIACFTGSNNNSHLSIENLDLFVGYKCVSANCCGPVG